MVPPYSSLASLFWSPVNFYTFMDTRAAWLQLDPTEDWLWNLSACKCAKSDPFYLSSCLAWSFSSYYAFLQSLNYFVTTKKMNYDGSSSFCAFRSRSWSSDCFSPDGYFAGGRRMNHYRTKPRYLCCREMQFSHQLVSWGHCNWKRHRHVWPVSALMGLPPCIRKEFKVHR